MKSNDKKSILDSRSKDASYRQSNYPAALLAEQIKLLYQQANKAFLATLILSTALVGVFWNYVLKDWLLGWLVAVYLLTLIRYLLVRSYFLKNPSTDASVVWGHLFVFGVFLSGILWGLAGIVFYIADSVVHQLFLAYLLGGMIAGALATLSSYKGAFLVFSVPVIFPFTYQLLTHESDMNITIAFIYLLFLFMMGGISHQLYGTVTDSLKFRFDNFELLNRLLQAKDDQHAINQELQAQIAEKDLTQKALQNAKEQLEQRVAERTEALALTNNVLHQEKELFQITLASIGDAVITTDALGNITYLNPIAESFTGWKNSDATGVPLQRIFNITDVISQTPIDDPLAGCLNQSEKSSRNQECRLVCENKQELKYADFHGVRSFIK